MNSRVNVKEERFRVNLERETIILGNQRIAGNGHSGEEGHGANSLNHQPARCSIPEQETIIITLGAIGHACPQDLSHPCKTSLTIIVGPRKGSELRRTWSMSEHGEKSGRLGANAFDPQVRKGFLLQSSW